MTRGKGGLIRKQATRGDLFVGRDSELEELAAGLEDARKGQGRLFLLSGEPGIGKSRLVDEFTRRSVDRHVRVLWGRCWEAGGAPAYWPWVQLLRSSLRDVDAATARAQIGAGAADIAPMIPEVGDLFSELPSPAAVDPDSARFQLFDSTTSVLLNIAGSEPLVLVMEDLHAADTPSLLLLRFVAGQVGRTRLLIIATYRDVELTPEHPLTATVAELSREPATRTLSLAGLPEDDVVQFVSAAAGMAVSAHLAAALRRETGGNPLYLGEAVRLLSSEGTLGQLSDPAAVRMAVPVSVREVIVRRLNHLDDECRRVLALAAVLGTEFTTEALRRMSETETSSLLDILDRTAQEGLLRAAPGTIGRFRFSHELVRETLYQEPTPASRIGLHRRAAEVLEGLYAGNEEPHLAELAHHYF
jgi:predicted ATPase